MKLRKAVITAAGRGTRLYPASTTVQKEMFPLVDVDGLTKPAIQIIAEEALDAGIEEICIVTAPGDEEMYARHFQGLTDEMLVAFAGKPWALEESAKLARIERALHFVPQDSPEGYGHAVYCAREWVGDEPFLLLLGDHVYLSHHPAGTRCARQLTAVYETFQRTVSSVQRTPASLLQYFGTVRGEPCTDQPGLYRVGAIAEKPSPDDAARELVTPGLLPGEYLCFFGMHVFEPSIFEHLEYRIKHDLRERGEFQLTTAHASLAAHDECLAYEVLGTRYDMGIPFGLVETQLALALRSPLASDVRSSIDRILNTR